MSGQELNEALTGIILLQVLFLLWSNATEAARLVDFNLNKPILPPWEEVRPPSWESRP